MKRFVVNALLVIVASGLALVAGEGAAQLYAYRIAQKGKLFEPDARLGWRTCPLLSLNRRNASGEMWFIETDTSGSRTSNVWPASASRRTLILGDSFGFGEGVDIEDRFDAVLHEAYPNEGWLNLGVMGYGTDQQVLSAERFVDQLQAGDRVILLTYFNDFYDILQTSIAGRTKPHFTREAGKLVHHPPKWGAAQYIRDRSYILSRFMMLLEEQRVFTPADLEEATALYQTLVRTYLLPLVDRGVEIIIAYHGLPLAEEQMQTRMQTTIEGLCTSQNGVRCLDLDPLLHAEPASDIFLADAHWTARGHAITGQALRDLLQDVQETTYP